CRGLPLQRLFSLVKQSRVLYGDDGLVGERLQQLNLSVRKRTHLRAAQGNCSDSFASTDKRDANNGAITESPGNFTSLRVLVYFRLQISDMDRFLVQDGTSDHAPAR